MIIFKGKEYNTLKINNKEIVSIIYKDKEIVLNDKEIIIDAVIVESK